MNLVRAVISFFLVALFAVSIAGWFWAGGQPVAQAIGSRVVLVLCGLISLGCVVLLWSARPIQGDRTVNDTSQQV
ncbi:hypothetical protein NZK35_01950 [Stieleria sp. ICT_E10.1]|uniref:hypothetical protein n=1 Tax=Stieleria sedimenti TaxID=2976331 RepID=UPI00217FD103|nr:hypothetical protein [Stieleria sedimenti]MCS7465430.1 hypothetical protein [Stieleria sedimenti]